jgi:hypothetical protein
MCGVTKPVSEFYKSNGWVRGRCKECMSFLSRQWHRDNPGRSVSQKRRHLLKVHYGITVADYDRMLREQGGVCAICGKAPTANHSRDKRLTIDHCHKSKLVRGLLCHNCNRALGLLGDDPIILRKAISHLLRSKEGAAEQGGQ